MIIAWIKKFFGLFRKKELPKALNEGIIESEISKSDKKKVGFINSLKVAVTDSKREANVTVLECVGDGTGLDNTVEC
ncbi:MAG: hypothetical protein K6B70_04500 [Clostridia bacterium]|nr:hypothetical protein [Clostridia bacterium]